MTPAKLAAREEFNSAFARAAQAAMKTHQQEKLNALRDAVLNVALGKEPESTRQERFLSLVDQFTTQHLRLLRLFDDPSGYFAARGKSMPALPPQGNMLASQLVSLAMPDLAEQMKSSFEERSASSFQFIELLISDLVAAKLITLHRLNETWNVPRFLGPRSTEIGPMATHLGNDFLAFITCEEIKGIG